METKDHDWLISTQINEDPQNHAILHCGKSECNKTIDVTINPHPEKSEWFMNGSFWLCPTCKPKKIGPVLSKDEVNTLLDGIERNDIEEEFHLSDDKTLEEYHQSINLLQEAIKCNYTNDICLELIKLAKQKCREAIKDGWGKHIDKRF